MPKAKTTPTTTRTPVKIKASPTSRWYLITMFTLLLGGLAWLVTYYIAGERIPFMTNLDTWQNFTIGFGISLLGLLMTLRWR